VLAVDPSQSAGQLLIRLIDQGRSKLIVFGKIPRNIAVSLSVNDQVIQEEDRKGFDCAPAPINQYSESTAKIIYNQSNRLAKKSPINDRACVHYDFMAEWNNLGFGSVLCDGSIWSISSRVKVPAKNLVATIDIADARYCDYAANWTLCESEVLWYNRSVGPVDSAEWRLIEEFITNQAWELCACVPLIKEIPAGYEACVTMRLDCDEDIESSLQLYQSYHARGIPFSLALHTSVLSPKDKPFLQKIISTGGALLSHSVTHPVNWGENYQQALEQAVESREAINKHIGVDVVHAVSPFHQNPNYAFDALIDAGYKGVISGIVCNHPEYLIARGGEVPFTKGAIISHSQQCMLHGDCMLSNGDPLQIYKNSFDISIAAGSIFGYLDHPFSERYQYGWSTEEDRIKAHEGLLDHIYSSGSVLFLSEVEMLEWLEFKGSIQFELLEGKPVLSSKHSNERRDITIEYKNIMYRV
jgi:hypothetical protein